MGGGKFTGLTHFARVPEAFEREYAAMRSANEAVSQMAWIAIALLYGVAGTVGGVFMVYRRGVLLARPAGCWAVLLAGLLSAATVSTLPLEWMRYAVLGPNGVAIQ